MIDVAKAVAEVMYEPEIKYPATALAYYAFISFIPLLLFVVVLFGQEVALEVYTRLPRFVTPNTQQLIYEALTTARGRAGAAVLAVVVLTWGGGNVAAAYLTAVKRIERLADRPRHVLVREGAVVLVTLTLAALAVLLVSMVLAVFSAGPVGVLTGFLVLLVVLTVTLVPLYYVPSRLMTTPSKALPGALTTAFGWTVLHTGIQVYSANAGQYAIYGILSGVIIILTTIYLGALVLMMGVVVNAVLATETDARPADGAAPA